MNRPHIIGLTGFAGVGKDTVADILVAHCGFRKLAFADALRAEVANGFGVSLDLLTDRALKDTYTELLQPCRGPRDFRAAIALAVHEGYTPADCPRDFHRHQRPRTILQWWGTEYRRRQDPDYWAKQLTQRLAAYIQNGGTRFVVTDCRFQNEAAALRNLGGQIWQITRPGITAATTTEGARASATDGAQFAPEVFVQNSGTPHELRNDVLGLWWARESGLSGLLVQYWGD